MGVGINVRNPGVWEQTQIKLFGKLPRRLAGEVVGALRLADDVTEVGFVVLVHTVSGNQGQRYGRVLFTDVFD